MRFTILVAVVAIATAATVQPTSAASPPCGGTPQIVDVVADGHHDNTDVVAAWLSEAEGRLQAVIQVHNAVWEPTHDDSDAAGFALLFERDGQIRYVRAEAPRQAPIRFDYGTWTSGGGFVSAGTTSGASTTGPNGAVTIDIPAAAGAIAGAILARPFVLTYDGITGTEPHWVDRAPGGVSPTGDEHGADFVVGSCSGPAPGVPAGPSPTTTSVRLNAPRKLVGGGTARVSGTVLPARAGVAVAVSTQGAHPRTREALTSGDGSFSTSMRISQSTRLRAEADGIGSQTRTVVVVSTVRVAVHRARGGGAVVVGRVRPRLPGRIQWLHSSEYTPTAVTHARNGRFRFRFAHPRPGSYRAVFIPSRGRAERSTSNKGVIR